MRCYPKPVRRSVPVIFGGNGDRALRRVAEHGDGWYGFNVALDKLPGRLEELRAACRAAGHAHGSVETAAAVTGVQPSGLAELGSLGLDELVVVEAPPATPGEAAPWVAQLTRRWKVGAT